MTKNEGYVNEDFLDEDLIEDYVYMLTEEEAEEFLHKYYGSFRRYRFTTLEQALRVYPDKPIMIDAHFSKVTGDLLAYMISPAPKCIGNIEDFADS